jgi:hypothetical protein
MAEVPSPEPSRRPVDQEQAAASRAEWQARRERERLFGSTLFGGSAWDILLDLFIAREEARDVTVSSICETAVLAEPAMLRCLAMLIEAELIVRDSHSPDPRGNQLTLSDRALGLMCAYFSRTRTGSGDAGA